MANQFVAFMDERHGLGAWVAEQIAADLFRNPAERQGLAFTEKRKGNNKKGDNADLTGRPVSSADLSLSLLGSGSRRTYGSEPMVSEAPKPSTSGAAYKTWTSPRASAEATSAAVISGQAQVGVLPLYEEATGFNTDTLSALLDFRQDVLGEYVAESNYVLAVPTDLIHEVDQAGFTDSFDAKGGRAFTWNAEKQRKYRGRIGTVLASADAIRHCAPAIEGMRARGIDVQRLPDGVDTYRAGLEYSQRLLDPNREVSTTYGPNGQQRVSKTKAANHAKPLVGVLLAFDKALAEGNYSFDNDYNVLEAEMAGADRVRTSFVATAQAQPEAPPPLLYHFPLIGDLARFMMDDLSEPVRSDVAAVRRFFRPGAARDGREDASGLRHTPGLAGRAADGGTEGRPYPYARVLYAIPTVGPRAKDHSKILRVLSEQGLSYRTQPLDQREGMPVIIAIDVPHGQQSKLRPVAKQVYKHVGARRLAAFPSVTPMVVEGMRPSPSLSAGWRLMLQGLAVIGLALAAFVAAYLFMGS